MKNLLELSTSKSKYTGGSWNIILPKNWSLIDDGDGVASFAANNSIGVLQFSSFIKDGEVSESELLEFAEKEGIQAAGHKPTTCGAFTGFWTEETGDGRWMVSRYLRCNSTMLLATYTCEIEDIGSEDNSVEGILSSLTSNRQ